MNTPTRIGHCLDVLEYDLLLAGAGDGDLERRLRACMECQRRLADLEASRIAIMTPPHVAAQAAAIIARLHLARSRRRSLVRFAAPAVALAAAVLVSVVWLGRLDRSIPLLSDEIQWKGGARFDVLQVAPGPPRVLVDGEPVAAGATLSFRAACPSGCSATLFVVAADGVAHVLSDRVAPPWPVAPGAVTQLPVSVDVDEAPGDDRVVAFLCEGVVGTAALRAALAGSAAPEVSGCEVHEHRVVQGGRRGPGHAAGQGAAN